MTDFNRRIQAVIFDWAGTTVDYGSLAPTRVFVEIFKRRGIEITVPEAREVLKAEEAEKLYRAEKKGNATTKGQNFNIFFSNIENRHGAI